MHRINFVHQLTDCAFCVRMEAKITPEAPSVPTNIFGETTEIFCSLY
jgi:hypothetical protein